MGGMTAAAAAASAQHNTFVLILFTFAETTTITKYLTTVTSMKLVTIIPGNFRSPHGHSSNSSDDD